MKKEIYLHVGHAKTATSHLQSAFAVSRDAMAEHGVVYPVYSNGVLAAERGHVSSGNTNPKDDLNELIHRAANEFPDAEKILFSSEFLFLYFVNYDPRVLSAEILDEFDINVFLFVRNPLEHMVSMYKQNTKVGKYTLDISDFSRRYAAPINVFGVLNHTTDRNIPIEVFNYSNHRSNVRGLVEHWLGIPENTLIRPPSNIVNRSLSSSEISVQQELGQLFDREVVNKIGLRLVNELPEIETDNVQIPAEALEQFLSRASKMIATVNAILPPAERYWLPDLSDAIQAYDRGQDPDKLTLTRAQLRLIVETIAEMAKRQ